MPYTKPSLNIASPDFYQKIIPPPTNSFLQKLTTSRKFYAKFEVSEPSLHLQYLPVIVALVKAQRFGHQPVCLINTVSSENQTNPVSPSALDKNTINTNAEHIEAELKEIFQNYEMFLYDKRNKTVSKRTKLRPLLVIKNGDLYEKNFRFYKDNTIELTPEADKLKKVLLKNLLINDKKLIEKLDHDPEILLNVFEYLQMFIKHDHAYPIFNSDLQDPLFASLGQNLIRRARLVKSTDNQPSFAFQIKPMKSKKGRKVGIDPVTGRHTVFINRHKTSAFEMHNFIKSACFHDAKAMLPVLSPQIHQYSALIRSFHKKA